MFSEILNPFLNVRNKIKNKYGEWVDQTVTTETLQMRESNNDSVSSSTEVEVFEVWNKKIIIESLTYGCTSGVHPRLWVNNRVVGNNWVGQMLHQPNAGGGRSSPTPTKLDDNEFLELSSSSGSDYLVKLRKPIILPNGGKLVFTSTQSSQGNITYKVVWREIEGDFID